MIGFPKNWHATSIAPVQPAIDEIEPSAIRMIGTRIGASALKPFGSFPYSATNSSYVLVTSELSVTSSALLTFFPIYLAYIRPAIRGKIEHTTPSPITSNRLSPTPSVLAAAIGPGVGGINTCEI